MRSWILPALLLAAAAAADSGAPSAYTLYQGRHYAQAQTLFARQGGYAGQFGAGAAAWKLNDYRAAAGHFGAALLLARDDRRRVDALYNLGNAHYGLGDWRAAVEAFEAVLQARPGDARAQANLAQAKVQLSKQGGTPFASDLRGRRGQLAQGEVNLDWESDRAVRELEAGESRSMVGGTTAPDGRLQGSSSGATGAEIAAAHLQSGLKKLELLGDRPQAMLKGMLRQDRVAPAEQGGEPW